MYCFWQQNMTFNASSEISGTFVRCITWQSNDVQTRTEYTTTPQSVDIQGKPPFRSSFGDRKDGL